MAQREEMNQTERPEEHEINLSDYLEVLFRRKWIVISCLAVVVLIAGIVAYRTTSIYEASTSVLIEKPAGRGQILLTELVGAQGEEVPAQIEIIRSRTIAEGVVRELKYDRKVFDISRNFDLQILDIEIPDRFIDEVFRVDFTDDRGSFKVEKDRQLNLPERIAGLFGGEKVEATVLGSGAIGAPFKIDSGLSFKIDGASPERGASFKIKRIDFHKAAMAVQEKITVSQARGANVINIKAQDASPEMATKIANSVANHIIQQNILQRSREFDYVTEFAEKQIEANRRELEDAAVALAMHKVTTEVPDLEKGISDLIKEISELEKDRVALSMKEQQIEFIYNKSQGDALDLSVVPLGILGDVGIQSMIKRLIALEDSRRSLLADYTERHPRVAVLSSQIDRLKRITAPAIRNILNPIRHEKELLSEEIGRLKAKLEAVPKEERKTAELQLRRDVLFSVHSLLFQRLNEAAIAKASTVSAVQVLDPAIVPKNPVKPNRKLNMMLAIVLGLSAGVGLAFFVNYFDNSIKSISDVEKLLGLSVFGAIPSVKEHSPVMITPEQAYSTLAESYASLRTNLLFSAGIEKKRKVIHITSAGPGEGKSTTVANLGITLALGGLKTLILDLDLRRPVVHHLFKIDKEPGITNLLAERAALTEVLRPSDIKQLYLIPVGFAPPNPSEFLPLTRGILGSLLNALKEQFDYIIIDSPPVLSIADAKLIGRQADNTFLIIEMDKTPLPFAQQAIKQLKAVDINTTGAIINRSRQSSRYGRYGYYYGYYGYYGKEGTGQHS